MSAASPTASPIMKAGIGLRSRHYQEIVASRPAVGWFEIHAENYMGGGVPLHYLDRIRAAYPISVHGVGLSLAASGGIDANHLVRLTRLVERTEPMLVSEHLAWIGIPGQSLYLNDLLPLPYTEEALALFATNVDRAQTTLKRQILIENPSLYLTYAHSAIPESEFLAGLVKRTGSGILCDVNNIYVSCTNVGGDPFAYLERLPADAVGEIHLAGHCVKDVDGTTLLIDDHGSPVKPAVWSLYERALRLFPAAQTLIEWDTDVPDLAVLVNEAVEADRCRAIVTGETNARAA